MRKLDVSDIVFAFGLFVMIMGAFILTEPWRIPNIIMGSTLIIFVAIKRSRDKIIKVIKSLEVKK